MNNTTSTDNDKSASLESNTTAMNSEPTRWIRACQLNELEDGQIYKFQDANLSILIANQNDTIRAVDSTCTHADADLSTGFLGPDGIRCPLHLSVFGLDDGVPKNPPAEKPLRVYNVKIHDGWIHVGV